MYTLGEIAGAVWPQANIPTGVRVTLLSRPHAGLRLMREHENYKRARADRLMALLDKVPPEFEVPEGGLTEEHKRTFWAGFIGDDDNLGDSK